MNALLMEMYFFHHADGDFIEQDIECYAMDYASSAKNKYKTPDYMTNVEQKK